MRLHHVSTQGGIATFHPRAFAGESRRLVWAVDDAHLPHYLLPRDCPRVCFRAAAQSSPADHERFLLLGVPVIAIESSWFDRATREALWLYDLPTHSFACEDANAGYHVSTTAVTPLARREVLQPLDELLACGAELRVVPSLRRLAEQVINSSLAFSCIRLRNLEPALAEAR